MRIAPLEFQMTEKWMKHNWPGFESRDMQKSEKKFDFFLEKKNVSGELSYLTSTQKRSESYPKQFLKKVRAC